jgi:hypothetical protein
MVYRGQVKNGIIVLDEAVKLPEGARVTIEETPAPLAGEGPTLAETLGDLIGKAKGLPPDFSRNHDHYIHDAPKR